jgi:hypothetical protein
MENETAHRVRARNVRVMPHYGKKNRMILKNLV